MIGTRQSKKFLLVFLLMSTVLVASCARSATPPASPLLGTNTQCGTAAEAIKSARASVEGSIRVLQHLACYDGGELEDVNRELGLAFVSWPKEFVAAVQHEGLQKGQIKDLFVMLPLEFVDRACDGAKELSRRREILMALDGFGEIKSVIEPEIARSIRRKQAHCRAD